MVGNWQAGAFRCARAVFWAIPKWEILYPQKPVLRLRIQPALGGILLRTKEDAEAVLTMVLHRAGGNQLFIFIAIHVHSASAQAAQQISAVLPLAEQGQILRVFRGGNVHRAGIPVDDAELFRRIPEGAVPVAVQDMLLVQVASVKAMTLLCKLQRALISHRIQ